MIDAGEAVCLVTSTTTTTDPARSSSGSTGNVSAAILHGFQFLSINGWNIKESSFVEFLLAA